MNKETIAFGTDGIRGHAEHYPFTNEALYKFGLALGAWAMQKYPSERRRVLIGCDTRYSGDRIKQALLAGLQNFPLFLVDGGIIPTPAVYQLIRFSEIYAEHAALNYAFGIVISASHNPFYDNGIKIFDAVSGKLSAEDEKTIINYFAANKLIIPNLQRENNVVHWSDAAMSYQKNIASFFPAHFLDGVKVVLDCAHGAMFDLAPALLRSFGAEVIVYGADPDGENINAGCGSLYPQHLQKLVVEHQAMVGFAFDGDGDRIVAVAKDGTIKDGDDLLALLLQLPDYASCSSLVGTVMSNSGLEEALKANNKTFIRTPVGDKHVVAKLEEMALPLGGEPSGHLIITNYLATSDALFVALKVLQAIKLTNNWVMKTFDRFPQVLLNVPVVTKKDLSQPPYVHLIAQQEARLTKGRILVRYSGTENILRIMTETENYQDAYAIAHELAQQFQEALKPQ